MARGACHRKKHLHIYSYKSLESRISRTNNKVKPELHLIQIPGQNGNMVTGNTV